MPFSTVLAKHSNKTVRLDTYQKLLLTQIDCYGQGSWKNGVSLHHLYDQRGAFANILIHGTVVGKVVYDVAQDDISADDYKAIHIDKTKFSTVSYIAFVKDANYDMLTIKYRNLLKKFYTVILMDNKMIKY